MSYRARASFNGVRPTVQSGELRWLVTEGISTFTGGRGQIRLNHLETRMTKPIRKSSRKKAGATRTAGLARSRPQDRAAAKSGVSKTSGAARKSPAATDDAARDFPDAVYQDDRRS